MVLLLFCLTVDTIFEELSDFILETRGLTKEFKGFTAVSDVNLKVQRGTIHDWINNGDKPCVIAFVLITADPVGALQAVG